MKKPFDSGTSFFETLIIICIISAVILVIYPTYSDHHKRSQAIRLADDFRTYASVFSGYLMDAEANSRKPSSSVLPETIHERLPDLYKKSVVGGSWEWSCCDEKQLIEIILLNPQTDVALLQEVDLLVDDGNLTTGLLTGSYDHLKMVIKR